MRTIHIAAFLGAISASSSLSPDTDFSLAHLSVRVPVAGREVGYILNINAYPRPVSK